MQIIYFDFDEDLLSNVSINKLKNFINKNNSIINKYIIVGHADKKGSKVYNHNLSLKRAPESMYAASTSVSDIDVVR